MSLLIIDGPMKSAPKERPDCYYIGGKWRVECVQERDPNSFVVAPAGLRGVVPGTKLGIMEEFITTSECPAGAGHRGNLLDGGIVAVFTGAVDIAWFHDDDPYAQKMHLAAHEEELRMIMKEVERREEEERVSKHEERRLKKLNAIANGTSTKKRQPPRSTR